MTRDQQRTVQIRRAHISIDVNLINAASKVRLIDRALQPLQFVGRPEHGKQKRISRSQHVRPVGRSCASDNVQQCEADLMPGVSGAGDVGNGRRRAAKLVVMNARI